MLTIRPLTCSIPDRIKLTSIAAETPENKWNTIALKCNDLINKNIRIVIFSICLIDQGRNFIEKGKVGLEIDETRSYVYIRELNNSTHDFHETRSEIKGIGTAGLETAIRVSFLVKKEGNIGVITSFSSAFFYFKNGLRFFPSREFYYPPSLKKTIKSYLVERSEEKKALLKEEILSNEDYSLFSAVFFDNAQDNLGRAPHNFDEQLRFGTFIDLNGYMAKKLKLNETPDRKDSNGKYHSCPQFFSGKTMVLNQAMIEVKKVEYKLV